jgi:integrase
VAYIWQRYRDENAEKRIAANMAYSGKAILPEFGDLTPDEVTPAASRAYIAKRKKLKRKPNTIWSELNHLQTALNWAAKQRIVPYQTTVLKPAKPPPRDRRLTKAEARRLLDSASMPHVELAIALLLATAGRVGAILDLTWDRVDMDRQIIMLANPDATGRRKGRATVPMTPDIRKRLREARKGALTDYVVEWAQAKVGSIKRSFALAAERAGLEDVTPHVLRHTGASWMAEAGRPMSEIAAVLGHSDSRITERIYAKFSPRHLRKSVKALDMSGVPAGSVNLLPKNET